MKHLLTILACSLILTSCNSFERVDMEGQPDECKDFYYVLEYYSVQGGDSAFIGTVYEKCCTARKNNMAKKIKSLCSKLYPDDIKGFQKCIK